jgi:hypothetical protein
LGFLRTTPPTFPPGPPPPPIARSPGSDTSKAAAADLDDDRLPRDGVFFFDGIPTGERLDGVVPLGFDPPGVHREAVGITDERRVGHDRAVKRDHGGEALDGELGQRAPRPGQRLVAGGAVDDQLGQHRVELSADDRAVSTPESSRTPGPVGRDRTC